jgi:hypothetical protein
MSSPGKGKCFPARGKLKSRHHYPASGQRCQAFGKDKGKAMRKTRLVIWFLAGFLMTFLGMALFATQLAMTAAGDAVFECRLWQYYLIEIDREMHSSHILGRTTGSWERAIQTGLEHILISVGGGMALLALGWIFRKIRGQ